MKSNVLILLSILASCGLESGETKLAKGINQPAKEEAKGLEPCTCFQKTTHPPKKHPEGATKEEIPSVKSIKQVLKDNKAFIEIIQSKIEALKRKQPLTQDEKVELLSLNEELVQELNHKILLLEQMNEILLTAK